MIDAMIILARQGRFMIRTLTCMCSAWLIGNRPCENACVNCLGGTENGPGAWLLTVPELITPHIRALELGSLNLARPPDERPQMAVSISSSELMHQF